MKPHPIGWIFLGLSQLIVFFSLGGLWLWADDIHWFEVILDPSILRIIRFTFWQAILSTFFSLLLAIPFARALLRRKQFWGRTALINLSGLAFVIPTIVAVIGIAIVHGRQGWVNHVLELTGLQGRYYLYGLFGIITAHVFFNLPLAMRIIYQTLDNIPTQSWRLAGQLGLNSFQTFNHLEWPLIRKILPKIAAVIFMLCFTSFAIVLTLGGGPKASTLEVAIYQAIRFDFDIARAVVLSTVQIMLCLGFYWLFSLVSKPFQYQSSDKNEYTRFNTDTNISKLTDTVIIMLCAFIIISPLLAVFIKALNLTFISIITLAAFWQALAYSISISLIAGLIALVISIAIAMLIQSLFQANKHWQAKLVESSSVMILITPPITLGMGLFLVMRYLNDGLGYSLIIIILVNALIGIPFVLRILQPEVARIALQTNQLCQSLGLNYWQQLTFVYFPQLRNSLAYALALACTLALGDMGVIALFGTQDLSTLPLLIYRLMAAYKMPEAAVVSLLLCLLCAAYFWGIDKILKYKKNHA